VLGTTTGLVTDIELLVTENIGITVITSSVVDIIVPLIMMIIPAMAISEIWGKWLLVPIFLLMGLLALISSLIPSWLFFIVAISCTLFILKGRGSDVSNSFG
jgi:hypothetical protein